MADEIALHSHPASLFRRLTPEYRQELWSEGGVWGTVQVAHRVIDSATSYPMSLTFGFSTFKLNEVLKKSEIMTVNSRREESTSA